MPAITRSQTRITRSQTRSNRTQKKPCCKRLCENIHDKCCYCADRRTNKQYKAFNNSSCRDVNIVGRAYYYCPTCKCATNYTNSQ